MEDMRFIPYDELTDEQRALVDSSDPAIRGYDAAPRGYGLDKLVYDPDAAVRASVAEQGYGLDKLMGDPSRFVRAKAASSAGELSFAVLEDLGFDMARISDEGYRRDFIAGTLEPARAIAPSEAVSRVEETIETSEAVVPDYLELTDRSFADALGLPTRLSREDLASLLISNGDFGKWKAREEECIGPEGIAEFGEPGVEDMIKDIAENYGVRKAPASSIPPVPGRNQDAPAQGKSI